MPTRGFYVTVTKDLSPIHTHTPPDSEGKFRVKRTKRGENGRERERDREERKQQKEKVELESKRLKLLFPTHCGKTEGQKEHEKSHTKKGYAINKQSKLF